MIRYVVQEPLSLKSHTIQIPPGKYVYESHAIQTTPHPLSKCCRSYVRINQERIPPKLLDDLSDLADVWAIQACVLLNTISRYFVEYCNLTRATSRYFTRSIRVPFHLFHRTWRVESCSAAYQGCRCFIAEGIPDSIMFHMTDHYLDHLDPIFDVMICWYCARAVSCRSHPAKRVL